MRKKTRKIGWRAFVLALVMIPRLASAIEDKACRQACDVLTKRAAQKESALTGSDLVLLMEGRSLCRLGDANSVNDLISKAVERIQKQKSDRLDSNRFVDLAFANLVQKQLDLDSFSKVNMSTFESMYQKDSPRAVDTVTQSYLSLLGLDLGSADPSLALPIRSRAIVEDSCTSDDLSSLSPLALNGCVILQIKKSRDNDEEKYRLYRLASLLLDKANERAGDARAPESMHLRMAFPVLSIVVTALHGTEIGAKFKKKFELVVRKRFSVNQDSEVLLPLIAFCQKSDKPSIWSSALLNPFQNFAQQADSQSAKPANHHTESSNNNLINNTNSKTLDHTKDATKKDRDVLSRLEEGMIASPAALTRDHLSNTSYRTVNDLVGPRYAAAQPATPRSFERAPTAFNPPTTYPTQESVTPSTETKKIEAAVAENEEDEELIEKRKRRVPRKTRGSVEDAWKSTLSTIDPNADASVTEQSLKYLMDAAKKNDEKGLVTSVATYLQSVIGPTTGQSTRRLVQVEEALNKFEKEIPKNARTEADENLLNAFDQVVSVRRKDRDAPKAAKGWVLEVEREVARYRDNLQKALQTLTESKSSEREKQRAHEVISELIRNKKYGYLVKWGATTEGPNGELTLQAILQYTMKKTGKSAIPCLVKRPNSKASLTCSVNLNPSENLQKQMREIFSKKSWKHVTFVEPVGKG